MWDPPGPGVESMTSALHWWILNHWTTREVLIYTFIRLNFKLLSSVLSSLPSNPGLLFWTEIHNVLLIFSLSVDQKHNQSSLSIVIKHQYFADDITSIPPSGLKAWYQFWFFPSIRKELVYKSAQHYLCNIFWVPSRSSISTGKWGQALITSHL